DETVSEALVTAGLNGTLFGSSGRLYYFGNDGVTYDPTTQVWHDLPYPDAAQLGEPAAAVIGRKLFEFGGRSSVGDAVSFDLDLEQWQLDGIAAPDGRPYQACAGAIGDRMFIVSSSDNDVNQPQPMRVYDSTTNSWTMPATTADFTGYCYNRTLPTWRGQ